MRRFLAVVAVGLLVERLKQIIAAQGWPTVTTAGRDGAEAAWLIAQHSDADPAFQARALELLTAGAQQGRHPGATSLT